MLGWWPWWTKHTSWSWISKRCWGMFFFSKRFFKDIHIYIYTYTIYIIYYIYTYWIKFDLSILKIIICWGKIQLLPKLLSAFGFQNAGLVQFLLCMHVYQRSAPQIREKLKWKASFVRFCSFWSAKNCSTKKSQTHLSWGGWFPLESRWSKTLKGKVGFLLRDAGKRVGCILELLGG